MGTPGFFARFFTAGVEAWLRCEWDVSRITRYWRGTGGREEIWAYFPAVPWRDSGIFQRERGIFREGVIFTCWLLDWFKVS